MKKLLFLALAVFCLAACTREEVPPSHSSAQQDDPAPLNRTGYVVTGVTWYEAEDNQKDATYGYDEENRLVCRTVYDRRNHRATTDTMFYQNGRVCRIASRTAPGDPLGSDMLFYYDDQGRLVKYEYGYSVLCFAYHNGVMDSMYIPGSTEGYSLFEYDERGNVIKIHMRCSETDMLGEPTGRYYMTTTEYEYDDQLRPNFNTDGLFPYDPVFGMGDDISTVCARNISPNNMVRCSQGPVTWEYGYGEQGLPEEMRRQFAYEVPSNRPVWRFSYRRVVD